MGSNRIRAAELTITVSAILILLVFVVEYEFPVFKYTEAPTEIPPELVENKTAIIGPKVGEFLWNYRVIDLIAQAFVLFAAATCCTALLRTEEEKR